VTALPPSSGAGWTIAELTEIERLKAISERNDWKLECDETDSGDPWVILYDRAQELTVLCGLGFWAMSSLDFSRNWKDKRSAQAILI
jgi:hypothetical protein